jgi:hypothetical protein
MFLAASLAFSAFASDSFFNTNPSPLHSGHIPEPRQASHSFIEASASSEALLFLLTRIVAAVPTTVAAIAIETAVSAKAGTTVDDLLAL